MTDNIQPILNVFLEMKNYNNLNIKSFFTRDNYFNIVKVLQKLTLSRVYLPSFLFLLKKQSFLFFFADNIFFHPIFKEFNLHVRYK